MFCIHTERFADGYTVIRLTDSQGFVCSYWGYDNWPAHCLYTEKGITI